MTHQKEQKESPVRRDKTALSAALAGLVLFTGLAGPVEAAVVNVEEKIEALRGAETGAQGTILGGVEERSGDSIAAEYTESYTQSYTQTYTQTYNQTIKPIEPAQS